MKMGGRFGLGGLILVLVVLLLRVAGLGPGADPVGYCGLMVIVIGLAALLVINPKWGGD